MTALEVTGAIVAAVAIVNVVAALATALRGHAISFLFSVNFLILGALVQLKFFG